MIVKRVTSRVIALTVSSKVSNRVAEFVLSEKPVNTGAVLSSPKTLACRHTEDAIATDLSPFISFTSPRVLDK